MANKQHESYKGRAFQRDSNSSDNENDFESENSIKDRLHIN